MGKNNLEAKWSHWLPGELKNTYTIRDEITRSVSPRKNFQAEVLESQTNLTRQGYQRLHAWAHMFGHEKADGIFWGHRYLNNDIQSHTIENEIKLIRRLKRPGVKIFLTVEVTHHKFVYKHTPFVESVTYKLEGILPGDRAKTLYEVTIGQTLSKPEMKALVDGRTVEIKPTPRRFPIEITTLTMEVVDRERYLKDLIPGPRGPVEGKAEGKRRGKPKKPPAKPKKYIDPPGKADTRKTEGRATSKESQATKRRNRHGESSERAKEQKAEIKTKREKSEKKTPKGDKGSKSTGNKGTFFRTSAGNFTKKAKVVAKGASIVEIVGGAIEWFGDRKQEEKVKREYREKRLEVDSVLGEFRIGTIQLITEVRIEGNPGPHPERFVCWDVQSFKDSAELLGGDMAKVDRPNHGSSKRNTRKELTSCRNPLEGYELKFHDRQVFYPSAGGFSGLIIGIYRPVKIDNFPSDLNDSEFMRRELTFSYDTRVSSNRFIMSGVLRPDNEILHLKGIEISANGESLSPENSDGRSVSFKRYPPIVVEPFNTRKKKSNTVIVLKIVSTPSPGSYRIESIFFYIPSDNLDTSAKLIERFKYNGEIVTVHWVQQINERDPKMKEPNRTALSPVE
jgi:hypothetical protein